MILQSVNYNQALRSLHSINFKKTWIYPVRILGLFVVKSFDFLSFFRPMALLWPIVSLVVDPYIFWCHSLAYLGSKDWWPSKKGFQACWGLQSNFEEITKIELVSWISLCLRWRMHFLYPYKILLLLWWKQTYLQ